MAKPESDVSEVRPTTIMHHAFAVYPAFAMLAGMQLDVFSPLADRPMNEEMQEIEKRLSELELIARQR